MKRLILIGLVTCMSGCGPSELASEGSARSANTAASPEPTGSPAAVPGRPGADTSQTNAPAAVVEFTPEGKLKQPVGYRKWVHVGTPVTPQELNAGAVSEFHAVYMDPASFEHYEKTGKLRDGTVMVKEFSSVGSKEASSGTGYFMGEFTGLEASIKDAQRFPDEPGHWAYFNFGTDYPLEGEVSREAVDSCNTCHQTEAESDWVFSQYYPTLRAAAPRSE